VLVSAQTGSGKTVAFGLAMADTLLAGEETLPKADLPLAVCIAPTRELAMQVKREIDWLYRDAKAKTASCIGGMDSRDERRNLERGVHIVVGTPGRLCDHIKRGALDMSALKAVVLDEADEMLKMGFREELELILNAAPSERRTLMFSATVPKSILGLTKTYQRDAIRVNTAAEAKQHLDIYTRVQVNRMTQRFNNRGFSVVALSGELSQTERSNALQALRDGRAQVCIATDVAARGLDLPDLELVIHADVPRNREALLHRSGRTGRAGRKGVSALIIAPNRRRNAERLLRDAGITAEWGEAPSAEMIIEKDNERLLANMSLDREVTEEEQTFVTRLLKAHSPEHTAFLRQYREGLSAPEELLPADYKPSKDDRGPREPRAPREDFSDGVWFSINVGRKQRAEPKWMLPMLMKSGGLKKGEIGAIKIMEGKTFVEVAPKGVDRFLDTIGPDGKIEKAITVTRVEGKPDFAAEKDAYRSRDKDRSSGRSRRNPYGDKKDRKDRKPQRDRNEAPKHSHINSDSKKNRSKDWDAPTSEEAGFKRKPRKKTHADMPERRDQDFAAPKAKKPHKKKLARAAAKKEGKSGKKKNNRKSRKT